MNAQVIHLDPVRIVMLRHTGSYDGIGPVFDKLWGWVESNSVPVLRTIGIYWDNPDEVPVNKLRSAACVEIPADYQVTDSGGLSLILDQLAPGDYAMASCVGPYENLAAEWTNLTTYCENTIRRKISNNPAFEVYVNDPSDTPPSQLITELYMPLV
jgi:AraC family transcriptional regulator